MIKESYSKYKITLYYGTLLSPQTFGSSSSIPFTTPTIPKCNINGKLNTWVSHSLQRADVIKLKNSRKQIWSTQLIGVTQSTAWGRIWVLDIIYTFTCKLLDKLWSEVSSPPPGTCLQLLSRMGFSIPTARRLSSNVASSRFRAFRAWTCSQEKVPTELYVYAIGGTRTHEIDL